MHYCSPIGQFGQVQLCHSVHALTVCDAIRQVTLRSFEMDFPYTRPLHRLQLLFTKYWQYKIIKIKSIVQKKPSTF